MSVDRMSRDWTKVLAAIGALIGLTWAVGAEPPAPVRALIAEQDWFRVQQHGTGAWAIPSRHSAGYVVVDHDAPAGATVTWVANRENLPAAVQILESTAKPGLLSGVLAPRPLPIPEGAGIDQRLGALQREYAKQKSAGDHAAAERLAEMIIQHAPGRSLGAREGLQAARTPPRSPVIHQVSYHPTDDADRKVLPAASGAVRWSDRAGRLQSCSFHESRLDDVGQFLHWSTGLTVVIESAPKAGPITFECHSLPLAEMLDRLCAGAGIGWTVVDDQLILASAPRIPEIRSLRRD